MRVLLLYWWHNWHNRTGKARMCILQLYYLAKFSKCYFDNSSSVCLIDSGIYVSFFEGTVPLAAFIFFLCLCYCPRLSWLIPVGSASNISHYHFISFILFSLHQQYNYKWHLSQWHRSIWGTVYVLKYTHIYMCVCVCVLVCVYVCVCVCELVCVC